ncbi:hypothetical protein Tcan_11056 [Toxocara canis]|uniref:Uncharacterized protein n=1 Tax=Toxocara canis TaxID=6265 RepID=A0A0B2UWR2_TOXCA|nr:hypothetical protein Tcan_11056 [Toxocara canis]
MDGVVCSTVRALLGQRERAAVARANVGPPYLWCYFCPKIERTKLRVTERYYFLFDVLTDLLPQDVRSGRDVCQV